MVWNQPLWQIGQTSRFSQRNITGQPDGEQAGQVIGNRWWLLGMPAQIADEGGPAGN
jgi:hypothetical protein